jgi:hypothetical protein
MREANTPELLEASQPPGGRDPGAELTLEEYPLFEQHDRWLEELLEYTDRKEAITCSSGYMPLTAITQEIAAACADSRQHGGQQIAGWQSMADDLSDTLGWIGPDLLALVDAPGRAVRQAITHDLLVTGPNGGQRLDDTKRPIVAAQTAMLAAVLDQDDVLAAAWRDLVTACRDIDHGRYPSERIAFLRDTLVGLSEYRKQDRRFFSPISTAVQVLIGNQAYVRDAQAMVGDPVDEAPYDPHEQSDLTEAERADLAARCILERPPAGRYVVWFRLSPGYFRKDPCVTHGDITFYEAQSLASALTDHDRVRDTFDIVPDELLTNEIRDLQLSGNVDDQMGFEYAPGLVYARVTVRDVERHRAVDTARMHLDTVLAVVGVHEQMWKVLGGYLFFDESPWNPFGTRWGLKEPLPEPVFYQNDHFATDLADMTSNGHVITADIAQRLQPPLRLFSALTDSPADAEAVVMAAVRAIEHSNTWIAPSGGLHWNAFIDDYLLDEYTLTAFAKRVIVDVFAAADHYRPNRTPAAAVPAELADIRRDVIVDGWGTRIDSLKTPAHVAALRRIYADHWLVRRLAETDDILSSGPALSTAFAYERRRVSARVKRLTRSRNAAIHGGPLSDTACGTIAEFAKTCTAGTDDHDLGHRDRPTSRQPRDQSTG